MWMLLFSLLSTPLFASEESEGLKAIRLGCERQKLALGCYNYANFMLKNGDLPGADKYFDLGCKLGHESSCSKAPWESNRAPASVKAKVDVEFLKEGREMFAEALKSCTKDTFERKAGDKKLVEKVHGMESGKCMYTQTIQDKIRYTCLFNESEQLLAAKDKDSDLAGLMANPEVCKDSKITTLIPK
ncbi:MAG TPA: hypothetical protein VNJ08_17740 [Bacteriovoracaceae bacterium]|nr:hypothetical protein [Bacteriovoracaceae bacterium]